METREFIQICDAVEHGDERYVRLVDAHGETHGSEEIGKVLQCDGRRLEVESGGERHNWTMEACEPVSGE